MKRVLATVLAFVLVVTGIYFVQPQAENVEAATSEAFTAEPIANVQKVGNVPTKSGQLFAGYFSDAACTQAVDEEDAVYAKFVEADLLKVMAQAYSGKVGDQYMIRLVSSVDTLRYKEVGFVVDGEKVGSGTTVFQKIKSRVTGEDYSFSPKVVGQDSEYFMTYKLMIDEADKDKVYDVCAYWVTLDGTTVVGPTSKSVSIADAQATNTVLLTVNAELAAGVTATYGNDAAATAKTAPSVTIVKKGEGYTNVRIQLADGDTVATMKSATKFLFSDGSSAVYRNYYTTHVNPASDITSNGCTDYIADRSWYDIDPNGKEYVVASSADMYGLALVVNGGKSLEGKKVTLVCDVTLNKGTAVRSTASTGPTWKKATGQPVYKWPVIGNTTSATFRGVFDGDGNEISGMYMLGGTDAFIGYVTGNGVELNNFKIVNSYIYTGSYNAAGLINYCGTGSAGTYKINDVYMDVVISTDGMYVGGFISQLRYGSKVYMNGCWFNGEIYGRRTVSEGGVSPFIAHSCDWTLQMHYENCVNTGKVKAYGGTLAKCTHTAALPANSYGTFAGSVGNQNIVYTLKNCLDLGQVTLTDTTGVGNLIGLPARKDGTSAISVTASNVYVTNESGRPSSYLGAEPNGLVFNKTNVNTVAPAALQNLSAEQLLQKLPETTTGAGCAWGYANDGTLMPKTYISWYNAK